MTAYTVFWVALGTGLGAMCRFAIILSLPKVCSAPGWVSILAANTIACFIMGIIIYSALLIQNPILPALVIAGFCGGLSTFSALALDIVLLWFEKLYFQLVLNLLFSVLLGFLFFKLAKSLT